MELKDKTCVRCNHKNTCEVHKESTEFHEFLSENPEFQLRDLISITKSTEEDCFSPEQMDEIHMELVGGFGKLLSNAFGSRCLKFEGEQK